ncbi:MAG: hypothetical protein JWM10_4574 [Myxococcaceae bacterium]|nr:hypothetical protein [Myxococcaceae bacterium]
MSLAPNPAPRLGFDDSHGPPLMVLRERRDVVLARPVLALTVYLEDERRWAEAGAAALLESFFRRPQSGVLRYVRSSARAGWRDLGRRDEVTAALRSPDGPRHLLRVQVADRTDVPSLSFTYREVAPRPGGACGYLQFALPLDTDAGELLALALEVAQDHPFACAVGGVALLWNDELPRNAFGAIRRLCKRYWALDVPTPEGQSLFAREHLPSASWLTLVGAKMAARYAAAAPALADGGSDVAGVARMPLRHGLLFRAGESPTAGDMNRFEYPHAVHALHHALWPALAGAQTRFPRGFAGVAEGPDDDDDDATTRWRERFLRPERWT